MSEVTGEAFVATLREVVASYLAAVDAWEHAYRRYYRMPGYWPKASNHLEPEQRSYEARRRALKEMLPRARYLCWKHGLHDPFTGLLHTALGQQAPQHRFETAIGRNERNAVADCLVQLGDFCRVWEAPPAPPPPQQPREGSLIRRLVSYFS